MPAKNRPRPDDLPTRVSDILPTATAPAEQPPPCDVVPAGAQRRAILQVEAQLIADLVKPGPARAFRVVSNALPADAQVIGATYDPLTDSFLLGLESAAFEPVPAGLPLPALPHPIAHTVYHERDDAGADGRA